jgi:hypothetical protein
MMHQRTTLLMPDKIRAMGMLEPELADEVGMFVSR